MPPDLPPVTTPHSAQIIGANYPTTSETGTVASVIALFEQAAESVGTGSTAEVMHALIEANATGQTPTALLGEFTEDQRAAFDRSLRQLNMGQGASVMAQDILNAKVALNGTALSFEAAVEELISSYAGSGGPSSPQNQAEFQQRYQELLQQAKDQAEKIGKDHKSTQDQLVSGVQKGATPEVPSTMAPTSSSNPMVPGMPDNAMGSLLQNVAGQMMKPPNLPMPNLGQMAQPMAQSAQQAIQELMKKAGGGGVPVTDDALKKLTTAAGLTNQGASLSSARGESSEESGEESPAARTSPLSGGSTAGENGGRSPAAGSETGEDQDLAPYPGTEAGAAALSTGEAGVPTTAPATSLPSSGSVGTTLSSGGGGLGSDTLASPQTRVSSGEAATLAAPLSSAAAPTGAAPVGAAPMMGPMMAPMMGGAAPGPAAQPASGGSAGQGAGGGSGTDVEDRRPGYRPERPADTALVDFGAERRGLVHATDMQHIAASMAASLVHGHQRSGEPTTVAVGLSGSQAVFATSDGLSFLAPGVKAPAHLTPLITAVPDRFVDRWLGCAQPWRPLLAAAEVGLIAPLDSLVSTDLSASQQGVLVLSAADVDEVNAAPATKERHAFDAIDTGDIEDVFDYLCGVWGGPSVAPAELLERAVTARWSGDGLGRERYAQTWVRYLLSAALVDLQAGDLDNARYCLRNALRVPAATQGQR